MKKIVFLVVVLLCGVAASAQNCDKLVVDLKKGTLNGLKPTATQAQVKKKLPCFTGDTEDGSSFNCGGGVFFVNHNFYFYTGNNYIEMRNNFNGTVSAAVIGLGKAEAVKKLNMGKAIRTQTDDTDEYLFFKTSYGCLVLKIAADKVERIAMHAVPAAKVELCL